MGGAFEAKEKDMLLLVCRIDHSFSHVKLEYGAVGVTVSMNDRVRLGRHSFNLESE